MNNLKNINASPFRIIKGNCHSPETEKPKLVIITRSNVPSQPPLTEETNDFIKPAGTTAIPGISKQEQGYLKYPLYDFF